MDGRRVPESAGIPARGDAVAHLVGAGRLDEAVALVTDLRWVCRRIAEGGMPAIYADLALAGGGSPVAEALDLRLRQNAHILEPVDPPSALGPILAGRLDGFADLQPAVEAFRPHLPVPHLANRGPQADQHAALLRSFVVHDVEEGAVSGIAAGPDGSWLAAEGTGFQGGPAFRWDVATGRRGTPPLGLDLYAPIGVTPDGAWLVGKSEGGAEIIDLATGAVKLRLAAPSDYFTAAVLAPDGAVLVTGEGDGTVRIWDITTGAPRRAFAAHAGGIDALAITADGALLATVDRAGAATVWDLSSGERRLALPGHAGGVRALAFAPDRSWLAVAGEHGVTIWDLGTGDLRHTLIGRPRRVAHLAVAPDGSWLATAAGHSHGSADPFADMAGACVVRLWDPLTGAQLNALTGDDDPAYVMAVAPDGGWLAAGYGNSAVRIWDPAIVDDRPAETADTAETAGTRFRATAPDGSWYAVRVADGTVESRDSGTDRVRRTYQTDDVHNLTTSPDGTVLIAHCGPLGRGTLTVWDAGTGEVRHRLEGHRGAVPAVAVSPDGSWLAAGQRSGTIRIWDLVTGALRHRLDTEAGDVSAVAVSPDGRSLASTHNAFDLGTRRWRGGVTIWDPARGVAVTAMRLGARIDGCAWTADGGGIRLLGRDHIFEFALVERRRPRPE